jgi:hypothetical protein
LLPVTSLVFISHSCNKDPAALPAGHAKRARLERARAVRSAIIEKLAAGFETWLDEDRLEIGDPWRLEIFRALYRSSAGVILLDEDAFASPWVRQEATILNFRRRLNPSFVLIPVLLDEGSSSRFDEGDWRPLALRDFMALKETPGQIADEVASRLSGLAEANNDRGLKGWVSSLAGLLRPMAVEYPDRLNEACAQLGITPEDWAADNGSAIRLFAQALLSARPQTVAAVAVQQVKSAVIDREKRKEMRRLLVPIWVNLDAAGSTATVLCKPPSGRRALLNTVDENVAREFVARAFNCSEDISLIGTYDVVGEDPEQEQLFAAVVQVIIDNCPPLRVDSSTDSFVTWLRDYPYRRPVVFLRAAIAAQELADLLDRLADRFPGISLFVLDGNAERTPDDLAVLRAPVIEPPPDELAEKSAGLYRGELTLFVGE